jgi:Zn-dependent protease with chaperone function
MSLPQSVSLVSPKEKTLLTIAAILAGIFWLGITLFTLGIVWIFIGAMALATWFGNGLLIAGLRAEAVRVREDQLSGLHRSLEEVCARLGLGKVPELYIIQSGGLLNAFATRHSGRHFVVIYSDMLEAFGTDTAEMKFLLGHEVGHIQRNHLTKRLLLAPALFLPFIGAAYSRACESSCDRHGAAAAGEEAASLTAMMTLAGGKEAGRKMDPTVYARQNEEYRGFFVSWYELVSGYPTLSRRVRDLSALFPSRSDVAPSRHPLAYLFALCSFGGGFGGRGSFLTTFIAIYVIVIMVALAAPAISKAMEKAKEAQAAQNWEAEIPSVGSAPEN